MAKKIFLGFKTNMQVNTNINNTNFKGYKNIVSNRISGSGNDFFSFISLQLNNEKCNDLQIWQSLQRELLKNENVTDVITFQCLKKYPLKDFFIGGFHLDTRKMRNLDNENLFLKAFSLISSLTKRLSYESLVPQDRDIYKNLPLIERELSQCLYDPKVAGEIIAYSFLKDIKQEKIAQEMNQIIQKKMESYFA